MSIQDFGAPPTIQIPQDAASGAQGPTPGPPDAGGGDPVSLLQQMTDIANAYMQAEPDAEDKLQGAKILQLIHQLLAKNQADAEQQQGGTVTPRIARKAEALGP